MAAFFPMFYGALSRRVASISARCSKKHPGAKVKCSQCRHNTQMLEFPELQRGKGCPSSSRKAANAPVVAGSTAKMLLLPAWNGRRPAFTLSLEVAMCWQVAPASASEKVLWFRKPPACVVAFQMRTRRSAALSGAVYLPGCKPVCAQVRRWCASLGSIFPLGVQVLEFLVEVRN